MSKFLLCFAVVAMMAIGFGAIAVILGTAAQDVKNLSRKRK